MPQDADTMICIKLHKANNLLCEVLHLGLDVIDANGKLLGRKSAKHNRVNGTCQT